MQYVGIDWAYRHARWCAISEHGEFAAEATMPADEDGLLRLVARLGPDVQACVEMMSGAVWVRDRRTLRRPSPRVPAAAPPSRQLTAARGHTQPDEAEVRRCQPPLFNSYPILFFLAIIWRPGP
jgi:hypothetical protein